MKEGFVIRSGYTLDGIEYLGDDFVMFSKKRTRVDVFQFRINGDLHKWSALSFPGYGAFWYQLSSEENDIAYLLIENLRQEMILRSMRMEQENTDIGELATSKGDFEESDIPALEKLDEVFGLFRTV